MALRGKPIEYLSLGTICITSDDLVEIISSLDNTKPLRRIFTDSGTFQSITDLAYQLPADYWNNIRHLSHVYIEYTEYIDEFDDLVSVWPAILNLPRRFSQLTTLELRICQSIFRPLHAVELIVWYLYILSETTIRSKLFEFNLCAAVFDKAGCDTVLATLVKEHQCQVQSVAEDKFIGCEILCPQNKFLFCPQFALNAHKFALNAHKLHQTPTICIFCPQFASDAHKLN